MVATTTGAVAGKAGMFRLLKYLVILAILGTVGLFGYSYLLEPDPTPPPATIELDAG